MRLIVLTQHQLQYAVLCATCQYQKDQTSRSQQNWHDGRTPGQQKCTWCISSSSIVTICYDSLWFKAVAWVNSKWGPCLARRTGPNTASSNQLKSSQNMSEQHPTPIISYHLQLFLAVCTFNHVTPTTCQCCKKWFSFCVKYPRGPNIASRPQALHPE